MPASSKPRILVVTPTLGASPFLDETMASIAALGFPVRHLLACPAPEISRLRERFPQCEVVADAGREGAIYGALNAALTAAGDDWDWFTYINDDDALGPGLGAAFTEHLRRANPEPVTYGDVALIGEDGRRISLVTTESAPRYFPALISQGISPLNQQGMLFQREVVCSLGGFDLRYRLAADLDFWVRAYAEGFAFRYFPTEVGKFRLRGGQLSGDTSRTIGEQQEIAARHFPRRISPPEQLLARWRFRLRNLPRYLERRRTAGWASSYQLLAGGGRR